MLDDGDSLLLSDESLESMPAGKLSFDDPRAECEEIEYDDAPEPPNSDEEVARDWGKNTQTPEVGNRRGSTIIFFRRIDLGNRKTTRPVFLATARTNRRR